jgi:hypothetical protein
MSRTAHTTSRWVRPLWQPVAKARGLRGHRAELPPEEHRAAETRLFSVFSDM